MKRIFLENRRESCPFDIGPPHEHWHMFPINFNPRWTVCLNVWSIDWKLGWFVMFSRSQHLERLCAFMPDLCNHEQLAIDKVDLFSVWRSCTSSVHVCSWWMHVHPKCWKCRKKLNGDHESKLVGEIQQTSVNSQRKSSKCSISFDSDSVLRQNEETSLTDILLPGSILYTVRMKFVLFVFCTFKVQ